jgi:hypothetical protein
MPSILQPQSRTERLYLEQMATSHWLLARFAKSERRIYRYELPRERELPLLDRVSAQRTRLERSFTSAMRELEAATKGAPGPHPAAAHPSQAGRKSRVGAGFEAGRAARGQTTPTDPHLVSLGQPLFKPPLTKTNTVHFGGADHRILWSVWGGPAAREIS